MKQSILLLGLAVLGCGILGAADTEKPDYQRYDLVRESSELLVETTFNYWTDQRADYDLHSLRFGGNLEYTFKTNHSIRFRVPYTLALYANPDARTTFFYSLGDITLGYEYLKQINHINLFVGPVVSIPLAETNEYAAREEVYSASNGRYEAGFSVTATGIRDPVVWNTGFQYLVGLPKAERFYTSVLPGIMQVSLGMSDLVNQHFGFALGLYQTLTLPTIRETRWDELEVSTFTKLEGLLVFEKDYVRVSIDAYLYPLQKPFVIGVVYGHKFDLSKKRTKGTSPTD